MKWVWRCVGASGGWDSGGGILNRVVLWLCVGVCGLLIQSSSIVIFLWWQTFELIELPSDFCPITKTTAIKTPVSNV